MNTPQTAQSPSHTGDEVFQERPLDLFELLCRLFNEYAYYSDSYGV